LQLHPAPISDIIFLGRIKSKMKNTRAEARAYNDITVKRDMTLEEQLELLYDDLIDYVKTDLGTEKYEAIKRVVNTFKKDEKDVSIGIILRESELRKRGEIGGMFSNAFNMEDLKKAIEIVLNADDIDALLDRITAELWYIYNKKDIPENAMEVMKAVLNDNYYKLYQNQIINIITAAVCKKYYNYFYRDLEYHLNKIIDNYTYWCESLESKVAELKASCEIKDEDGTPPTPNI
uniref:hypothetical protein n=1 Tax=Campylobacter vicugnae TaxID=1660076 RepID=UPI001F393BDD